MMTAGSRDIQYVCLVPRLMTPLSFLSCPFLLYYYRSCCCLLLPVLIRSERGQANQEEENKQTNKQATRWSHGRWEWWATALMMMMMMILVYVGRAGPRNKRSFFSFYVTVCTARAVRRESYKQLQFIIERVTGTKGKRAQTTTGHIPHKIYPHSKWMYKCINLVIL